MNMKKSKLSLKFKGWCGKTDLRKDGLINPLILMENSSNYFHSIDDKLAIKR